MVTCKFVDAADESRIIHQHGIQDYDWMSDDICAKQVMLEEIVQAASKIPQGWRFRIKLLGARFHGIYQGRTTISAEGTVAKEGLSIFVRPPVVELRIPSLEKFREALSGQTVVGRL